MPPPRLFGNDPGADFNRKVEERKRSELTSQFLQQFQPTKQLAEGVVEKAAKETAKGFYDYAGSTFSAEQDKPGQSKIRSKVFEDIASFLLPKRVAKAVGEIGEGEIPFTQRSVKTGLGAGEEQEIARQLDAYNARRDAERRAREAVSRAVAAGAFYTNAPLGGGGAGGVGGAAGGSADAGQFPDEFYRVNPPDP